MEPLLRRAAALALSACLVGACTATRAPEPGAAPSRPASSTPDALPSSAPSGAQTTPLLPRVPARRDPKALAGQLDLVALTLHDPDAKPADVRRAGELQQLAVRALADASASFRRQVTARLGGKARALVAGDLRAALSLSSLTDPQPRLPRWRIVTPPPPAELRGHYRAAQRRTGVPWNYLAAIHLVETRMGRIRGTSTAGARGPMQFIPSTWDLYGGNGDINDPHDAIHAAARLLKAHGAPGNMADALWHYNPSDSYVRAVSEHARTMQRTPAAFRGYWHWRVLYRHERGTYVLPVGYPERSAQLLPGPRRTR